MLLELTIKINDKTPKPKYSLNKSNILDCFKIKLMLFSPKPH